MAAKKLRNKPSDDDSFADLLDLDLDELFKRKFGEPIIDVNESLEDTMKRFFKPLDWDK
jgi:hypothetical protein